MTRCTTHNISGCRWCTKAEPFLAERVKTGRVNNPVTWTPEEVNRLLSVEHSDQSNRVRFFHALANGSGRTYNAVYMKFMEVTGQAAQRGWASAGA